MLFRKFCIVLTLTALLTALFLRPGHTAAYAREAAREVVLTLGSKEALLNDSPYQLDVLPVVLEGTTFLPVRFVAEQIIGAVVNWDLTAESVQIMKNDLNLELSLKTGQSFLNEQEVEITRPPFLMDGRTLVPLRFLAEHLEMHIAYNAVDKAITVTEVIEEIEEPVKINMPPVITSLGLLNNHLKIGEEAKYSYTFQNEDGEGIAAEEWSCLLAGDSRSVSNAPRAFFRPGEYLLFLRIKDTAGNWSETVSASFTVSTERLMTETAFKFLKPVYGEIFENGDNINFNQYDANESTIFKRSGPVVHMSNNPEEVAGPGILYRSEVSANFRLFYHHLNDSAEKLCLYIIAENNGPEAVTLRTLKSGAGGPLSDYMSLGQTVAIRYLASQPTSPVSIKPGEKLILNPGSRSLKYQEAVTDMQDFQADGVLTLSVVMGPEKAPDPAPPEMQLLTEMPAPPENEPDNLPDYLLSLPVLPRHFQQVRGVFPGGDCLVTIQVNGEREEKIILGKEDSRFDTWVDGVDPLTGDLVESFGNYGTVYRIRISAPEKTGVLLNPRGSIFRGAFQAPDGNAYRVPATDHFTGLNRAAVLGVVEAGETAEFIYTPPSGSDTPVVIALIPKKFWGSEF